MIYSREVEEMCPIAKGVNHGPAPIPEEGKWVKAKDINKFMSSIRMKNINGEMIRCSDITCATKWSALKTFFDFLKEQDYIGNNPVAATKRPTVQKKDNVVYMDKLEIDKVLDNIKDKSTTEMINRNVAIFSLGVSTGLRVSAITQINIEDVNFINNTISVIEKRNKYRVIQFGDNLKCALQNWLGDREKYFNGVNTDAFFVGRSGERISTDAVRILLKTYADGIDGKHITPHKMRASTATNLYEKTGDIFLVADQLGHANISTTKKYTNICDKRKQERVFILDDLI